MFLRRNIHISKSKLMLDLNSHVIVSASVISSLIFSSCGPNTNNPIKDVVQNISVKTYKIESDDWVQMNASLSTGGFLLGSINVPVVDPKDHSRVYGQVSVAPNLCNIGGTCQGGGDLVVSVNLTLAAKIQGMEPLLPNGTPLPIGGLQNTQIVTLPISDTNGRVYLAMAQGAAMLGAAIPFSQLDPAGQYVPGLNIFQPIQINSVNLLAGIFAGAAPKTTGVGVFADISNLINQNPVMLASASTRLPASQAKQTLVLKAVRGSSRQESKLFKKLYKLHQKRTLLSLE